MIMHIIYIIIIITLIIINEFIKCHKIVTSEALATVSCVH